MARDRLRRRRRKREVTSRVRQVWEGVTTALALLTGIYLILTTIDPTRAETSGRRRRRVRSWGSR